MVDNRLIFLKDAFSDFELRFADDFKNAVIFNPNYNEKIIVYDDESEFTVCFSFQHRHFEDEADVVEWIGKIISGNTFAIEFFNNEQRCFGGDIDAEELHDLSYEKPDKFTGLFGLTNLPDVADSFKIRGWDSKNNFDCTITREADGSIAINRTCVGIL